MSIPAKALALLMPLGLPALALAIEGTPETIIRFCVPIEFILFAATPLGVALLHNHTLPVALTGLAAITAHKQIFTGFKERDRG